MKGQLFSVIFTIKKQKIHYKLGVLSRVDFMHSTAPCLLTRLFSETVEDVKMSLLASRSLWSGMGLKAYLNNEFMFF